MTEGEIQKDDWFVFCDRCCCKIYEIEDNVEEDGLIYCKSCYTKLLEKGEI